MSGSSDDDSTIRPSLQTADDSAARRTPSIHADTVAQALPPGTRIAEFEIRGVIGEGGFSIVYQAWDESLHRLVALKEYIPYGLAVRDPSRGVTARSAKDRGTFDAGLTSFINEARLLASFDHPSLVKVHRFWQAAGTAYMVMPWYQGPTLKKALLQSGTRADQRWLLRLLDRLTDALGFLHRQDCFHRDIAPDNILLLGADEVPLLLDFGAARRVIGTMTHDLTAILKQGYAPIEQYGQIPGMRQGPWTDVYALAAVVYFAIRGETPPAAVARLVNDTYRPLTACGLVGFDGRFLQAIDAALAVRPEHRTASIREFRRRLGLEGPPRGEHSTSDAATPTAPGSPAAAQTVVAGAPERSVQAPRRRWTAALLSLIGAGVLAFAIRQGMSSDPVAPAGGPAHVESAGTREPRATASAPDPMTVEPARSVTAAPPSARLSAGEPSAASSASGDLAVAAANPAASVAAQTAVSEDRDIAAERTARRSAESAVANLQRLASEEQRDVSPVVRAVRDRLRRAQLELQAGRADQAATLAREGQVLAAGTLNGLVDELVRDYGQLAQRARADGEPEIARQALERSKKVAALRR